MKLNDTHKTLIVKRFAQFWKAPQIRDELLHEFNISVKVEQLYPYDPSSAKSAKMAAKWKRLHAEERQKYVSLDEMQKISLYHMAERIRELQDTYFKLKQSGAYAAANATLEQIAKEQGQAYTNKALIEAQIEKERDQEKDRRSKYTQINNIFNLSPGEGVDAMREIQEGDT
jgi:hypothetical protein